MKLKKTLVISAYPCCGKTYLKEHGFHEYSILDSDSSKFNWIERDWTESERNIVKNNYLRLGFADDADKATEDYFNVIGKEKARSTYLKENKYV